MDKRHYKAAEKSAIRDNLRIIIRNRIPVFFLSLETTGLNPMTDRVIAIRLTKTHLTDDRTFEVEEEKALLIHSEKEIPENIEKISGITNEQLADAENIENVMRQIYYFLGKNPVVMGWNTESFLIPFFKNAGFYSGYMVHPGCVIDLMDMAKLLMPGLNSYSMKAILKDLALTQVANKNTNYIHIADILVPLMPLGNESAKILKSRYWSKGYHHRYIFFETDHGNIGLDCCTGYWVEQTIGVFDVVDLNELTSYICYKQKVHSIWDFMNLYTEKKERG